MNASKNPLIEFLPRDSCQEARKWLQSSQIRDPHEALERCPAKYVLWLAEELEPRFYGDYCKPLVGVYNMICDNAWEDYDEACNEANRKFQEGAQTYTDCENDKTTAFEAYRLICEIAQQAYDSTEPLRLKKAKALIKKTDWFKKIVEEMKKRVDF